MTHRVLAAALPASLQPLLLSALSMHPDLPLRTEGDLARIFVELDGVTRALVGDGPTWRDDGGGVTHLVCETLAEAWPGPGVWSLSDLRAANRVLRGLSARLVVWLGDARLALLGVAQADDPVEAAVFRSRAWCHALGSVQRAQEAVLLDPRQPSALLQALGLSPHPQTEAALSLLQKVRPPKVPELVEAAFRVWPTVQAALPPRACSLPELQRHPAVLAARAWVAARQGSHRLSRDLALAAWRVDPSPSVRVQVLRILGDLGETDALVERAEAWRAETDSQDAWIALLEQAGHPASFAVAARARVHASVPVRSAAGRWLVHHGLDREGAEEVCSLRGVGWTSRTEACAGGHRLW